MTQIEEGMVGEIRHAGRLVPVVVFYSVQGGVGKSTLARKFAELVTMAPGREEHKPNVLLVDLDVNAQGLTFRMASNVRQNYRTVHEAIQQRDASVAQAIPVAGATPVTSALEEARNGPGAGRVRGALYLVPAAPPGAQGLYDVAAEIDKKTLADLLTDMIRTLVHQNDIACVVIDCPPGLDPYTAAAAAIADRPLLIGRNEEATFQQIWVLPERFREWYSQFQPARQRVIINAVSVIDTFGGRSKRYSVLDYIPLVSEVIQDTEGIPEESRNDFRMLLFEKWVIDIIQKVLHGIDYLIPNAPDVLGEEWADTLRQLNHSERAPAIRRLRVLGHLRWAGAALAVLGVALVGVRQVVNGSPASLTNWGILATIAGLALAGIGWYAEVRRQRTLSAARALVMAGPDGVFKKIQGGESDRKDLKDLKKIADSVPREPEKQPTSDPHAVTLRLGGVK